MVKLNDQDIDSLINDLKSHPDKIFDTDLSEEQLLNITKKISPYSYIKPRDDSADDEITLAAISHTNLEEDYQRRFLMTSMVGFIYRMYDEFQIESEDRVWVDETRKTPKLTDKEIYTPFTIEKITGNIRQINKYVKEYELIKEQQEKLKNSIITRELEGNEITPAERKEEERLEKSILSLTYIMTHLFTDIGKDAERRTENLVEKIKKYKDVYESILNLGYKPPPPVENVVIEEEFCKRQIKNFIDKYFEYNPDEHVRKPFNKDKLTPDEKAKYDKIDKYRPTMELLQARVDLKENDSDLKEILEDRETYNACMHLLNNRPNLLRKLADGGNNLKDRLVPLTQEKKLAERLPPDDTFHRWGYYTEVNMEEIRNVVAAVYDEKPVLDLALQIYDIFKGTPEEVEEQKKKWISKYNEELPSDVSMVPVGNWVLLANYKKNRDEINFYNRHTEVLRRIMEKHEEDKRLGKDLMMKRVKKAKTKNVKEAGKDAEILRKYQTQYQNLTQLGAKRALSYEEQKEIENIQRNIKDLEEVADVPDNAIQVNVFTHDTEKGEFKKSAIYTESEAPLTSAEIEEHQAKAQGLTPANTNVPVPTQTLAAAHPPLEDNVPDNTN